MQLEDENGGRNTVHGSDVPLEHRLEWIVRARNGEFSDHIQQPDLDKYLYRGLVKMPWTEMSQSEFLKYVVSFPIKEPKLITDEVMLKASTILMEQVVRDPERLFRSAYKVPPKPEHLRTKSCFDQNTKSHAMNGFYDVENKGSFPPPLLSSSPHVRKNSITKTAQPCYMINTNRLCNPNSSRTSTLSPQSNVFNTSKHYRQSRLI